AAAQHGAARLRGCRRCSAAHSCSASRRRKRWGKRRREEAEEDRTQGRRRGRHRAGGLIVKFLSKVTEQKGIVARVNTLTAVSNTFTPNCDTTDIANITLGATNTIANPTGTPTDGQSLILRLIQDGTGGRTIGTWGNQYHFAADLPPSLHSGAGRVDLIEFRYRSAASRWECMSELDLRGVVGRNQRTTPIDDAFSSATSVLTAQAFVRPGRTYRITGVAEIAPSGGSAILADYSLRYTTDGSTPGTGSAQL